MLKLNLGCGPHAMAGWLNYDVDWMNNPKIVPIDLSKAKLPHLDNTVDLIFSEHFIEHLTRGEGQALLQECHRVLKPGGRIRLSTPDLKAWASDYLKGLVPRFEGVWEPATDCQALNEGMRLWGHQFLYDIVELSRALRDAGFGAALKKGWHQSPLAELQGLEVRPSYNDLIMEASKS